MPELTIHLTAAEWERVQTAARRWRATPESFAREAVLAKAVTAARRDQADERRTFGGYASGSRDLRELAPPPANISRRKVDPRGHGLRSVILRYLEQSQRR